jgi:hypothetical protein
MIRTLFIGLMATTVAGCGSGFGLEQPNEAEMRAAVMAANPRVTLETFEKGECVAAEGKPGVVCTLEVKGTRPKIFSTDGKPEAFASAGTARFFQTSSGWQAADPQFRDIPSQ